VGMKKRFENVEIKSLGNMKKMQLSPNTGINGKLHR
jgi:hypothetical protein